MSSNLGVIAPAGVHNPQYVAFCRVMTHSTKCKQRIGRIMRMGPVFGYDVGTVSTGCPVLFVIFLYYKSGVYFEILSVVW